jgi:branched-chain amino acid transport system substrate-binding protein
MRIQSRILGAALLLAAAAIWPAAADTPGVTATEIKIGNTMPYSGPASSYGVIGRTETAYFKDLNERGGIAGHKINFISLDDSYSPPKTVEDIRQLVEQDKVAFTFSTLGTPTNTAIQKYLNANKVPHLFVATGADKWGNYQEHPWTIGWVPSYRTEAQIYAKYILANKPDAKIAILYQNDDFGKDYVLGMKDVLGDRYAKMVTEASYETSDPTIESQIVTLQSSGADTLLVAAIPKFAAQAIRKVYDIGWKPTFIMSYVSVSVGAVLEPAGKDKAVGLISAAFLKDPTDPEWKDDPGMNEWRAFMAKNMPGADLTDVYYVTAFAWSQTLEHVLRQCNGDFSRENVMKQATNIKNLPLGTLLPGIMVNTSPTNYHPITQMQLERWNGSTWVRFGDVISGIGS